MGADAHVDSERAGWLRAGEIVIIGRDVTLALAGRPFEKRKQACTVSFR
jgi:hypothetical protein